MKVSSGCAVVKYFDGEPYILLVSPAGVAPRPGNFGIPKGLIENDEDTLSAAIRETEEETGIKVSVIDKLIEVFNKNKKKVLVYIAKYKEGELKDKKAVNVQKDEVSVAKFIRLKDSHNFIYNYQAPIIESVIDYLNSHYKMFL